ncbi:MAG: 2Fe-2S iron-sulfur cluster binding domain-containing protein [Treponema sp.]|nr:2Fe-2S iron-sulfur cluster binding domain-containing protein [Treponema sp.]
MKLTLTINEEKTVLDADPDMTLLELLRRQKILSVKCGCGKANCGSCAVLLDGKAVLSCLIPCGIVRNSEIVTMEHFSKQAACQEILKGFEKAGVNLCGYCNPGKIFAAWEIISTFSNPNREQIAERVSDLRECCAENDALINGIIYAAQIHFEKERMKKNAK